MIINLDHMGNVWGQYDIGHMGLSVFRGITTHLRDFLSFIKKLILFSQSYCNWKIWARKNKAQIRILLTLRYYWVILSDISLLLLFFLYIKVVSSVLINRVFCWIMWFNHDEPLAWLKARGYSHAVYVAFLKKWPYSYNGLSCIFGTIFNTIVLIYITETMLLRFYCSDIKYISIMFHFPNAKIRSPKPI